MALIDALLLDPAPFNFWIANRTDGIKGSGLTPGDPWDGSTQARFDEAMNLFASQSNVTIYLGPGQFLTNGLKRWRVTTPRVLIREGTAVYADFKRGRFLARIPHIPRFWSLASGHFFSTGLPAFSQALKPGSRFTTWANAPLSRMAQAFALRTPPAQCTR